MSSNVVLKLFVLFGAPAILCLSFLSAKGQGFMHGGGLDKIQELRTKSKKVRLSWPKVA